MLKFRIYIFEDIKENEMFKDIVKEYKERLNDYYTIYIFDKFDDMYNFADKIEKDKLRRDYSGRTFCYQQLLLEDNKEIGYCKTHGNIYLCNENNNLTYGTIQHEVSHAIIGYFNRHLLKNNPIYKHNWENEDEFINEELFCYMVGYMCNVIITNFLIYIDNKKENK